MKKSMAKQMAPIDPMTGMPIQPQMTPQPNTVGMPGSTPMPAGIGHTLPEHGIQAGGRKNVTIHAKENYCFWTKHNGKWSYGC